MNRSEKRILIVDDDDYIRVALQDLLEDEGYHVFPCSDAFHALEVISKEGIKTLHLILADIKMPYLNGLDFLQQVIKNDATIPFMVISAHYESSYIERAKDLGVKAFINKPFDNDELLEKVEAYIR